MEGCKETVIYGGTAVIDGEVRELEKTCIYDWGKDGVTRVQVVKPKPVSEVQRRLNRAMVDEALEKMYFSAMETRRKLAEANGGPLHAASQ